MIRTEKFIQNTSKKNYIICKTQLNRFDARDMQCMFPFMLKFESCNLILSPNLVVL